MKRFVCVKAVNSKYGLGETGVFWIEAVDENRAKELLLRDVFQEDFEDELKKCNNDICLLWDVLTRLIIDGYYKLRHVE